MALEYRVYDVVDDELKLTHYAIGRHLHLRARTKNGNSHIELSWNKVEQLRDALTMWLDTGDLPDTGKEIRAALKEALKPFGFDPDKDGIIEWLEENEIEEYL